MGGVVRHGRHPVCMRRSSVQLGVGKQPTFVTRLHFSKSWHSCLVQRRLAWRLTSMSNLVVLGLEALLRGEEFSGPSN